MTTFTSQQTQPNFMTLYSCTFCEFKFRNWMATQANIVIQERTQQRTAVHRRPDEWNATRINDTWYLNGISGTAYWDADSPNICIKFLFRFLNILFFRVRIYFSTRTNIDFSFVSFSHARTHAQDQILHSFVPQCMRGTSIEYILRN